MREWGKNRNEKDGYIFLNKSSTSSTRKDLDRVRRSNRHACEQSWAFDSIATTQMQISWWIWFWTIDSERSISKVLCSEYKFDLELFVTAFYRLFPAVTITCAFETRVVNWKQLTFNFLGHADSHIPLVWCRKDYELPCLRFLVLAFYWSWLRKAQGWNCRC